MTNDRVRSAAPIISLGVLVAAVALTGVGIAASGAADPSHPGTLRVAQPAPTVASEQPSALAATTSPAGTPQPGTTAGAASASPSASVATPGASAASAKPLPTPSASVPGRKASATPTAKPRSSARATGSSAPAATVQDGAPSASTGSSAGAVPGSYAETSTGTASYAGSSMPISGTPTLTVATAQGQAQTQTVSEGSSTQVEKLVFGTNRVDATEISISSEVIDADFVLSPQEPLIELSPGATWSWKADSTDAKEHLAFSGSYAGTEQVVIGGQTETTAIVKSTLTLTGSIATTITLTDDYDPVYKLDVREHSIFKGSFRGVPYDIDTTTTLNSLKPQ